MAYKFRGTKVGMTQVFEESGGANKMVPCTVVHVEPNVVCRVKTEEKDGYSALVLGSDKLAKRKRSKPLVKFFEKIDSAPLCLHECRVADAFDVGHKFTVADMSEWAFVDATAVSKGKGFQGSIKKLGHTRGPKSHGSQHYRLRGSLGCRSTPGRVFKNKGMPSHMGSERKTVQSLKVVRVDGDKNVILIRGQIPGAVGGVVYLQKAIKKS